MNFMLFSTKGGTGKTPFAVSLAVALASDTNVRTALIDFDGNQASATHILHNRLHDNPDRPKPYRDAKDLAVVDVVQFDEQEDLTSFMDRQFAQYQHLVFDTGGYDSQFNRKLMEFADILIIPIRPQASDHWALINMLNLFEDMSAQRENLPKHIFVVFTQCSAHSSHRADVRNDIAALNEYLSTHSMQKHITTMKHATVQRHTYNQAAEWGLGITEAGNEKARDEFQSVYNEMIARILANP